MYSRQLVFLRVLLSFSIANIVLTIIQKIENSIKVKDKPINIKFCKKVIRISYLGLFLLFWLISLYINKNVKK